MKSGLPSQPAKIDPPASRTNGTVMSAGDSWMWVLTSAATRHSPWKTRKSWRNM
ncbi:MAG: hypothetical protein HYU47_05405 [Deltaproteobacteria bacterium]|nr:hypothetical protein [Deltaproteobacteria bacterium]